MACELLDTNVDNCLNVAPKGYKRLGWITPYVNIDQTTKIISNGLATFNLKQGQFYELYDGSGVPFDGSKPISEQTSAHKFIIFHDNVVFPLNTNSKENGAIVNALNNGSVVVMLDPIEIPVNDLYRSQIFGLSSGLKLVEPLQDLGSDVAWTVKLEDKNTGFPVLFFKSEIEEETQENVDFKKSVITTAIPWITGTTTFILGSYCLYNGIYYVNTNVANTGVPSDLTCWSVVNFMSS